MSARWGGWAVGVLGGVLCTGCFEPPPEAVARLAALKAETKEMNAALDSVEDRLLGNQARVHLWTELSTRHQQVSAVACTNADSHVQGIMANLERQQEKARRLRRGGREPSVLSRATPVSYSKRRKL